MSRAVPFVLRALVSVLACAPELACSQAERPQHDLFARPAPAAMHRLRHAPDKSAEAAAAEPQWNPGLRAVMVAGPDSMVNVDGSMVRIGEEIRGYRLIEVRDGEAVFVKDGKRHTVGMRGGVPEQDDARVKQ